MVIMEEMNMKKIISIFALAACLLVSCSKQLENNNENNGNNPVKEGLFAPGKYSFNVTIAETKAVKTAWENGDKIFVFFDDSATRSATSTGNLPYITLNFNSEGEWIVNDTYAPADIPATGTLSAVYCPYGNGLLSNLDDKIYVSRSNGYYMTDTDVPYNNVSSVVSFRLVMEMTLPYAQIFIPAEGLDKAKNYTLSVRNGVKIDEGYAAGIKKSYSVCFNPADGSFSCDDFNIGDAVHGYWKEDGLYFYGLASLGVDKGFVFDLRDNGSESAQILYFYTKKSVDSFEGGSAIKLPAIGSWTMLTNDEHYKCHLYADSTLIINESRYERADNAFKHGEISMTYNTVTDFNMFGSLSQPWKNELAAIKYAEFGRTETPGQFRAVFSDCVNLETVDTKNLNMSNNTSLKNAFRNCKKLKTIDLSNFVTTKCTSLEATFYSCEVLSPDLSTWNVSKVTDMRGLFYGCKFKTLDISSFNTASVTQISDMFRWCNKLETIYVSENFVTTGVTNRETAVFINCSEKLVGGNGTTWSSANVSVDYARIDKNGERGYFTLKP